MPSTGMERCRRSAGLHRRSQETRLQGPSAASRRPAKSQQRPLSQMPVQHKVRFDGVMPRALAVAASMPNPDQTLERILDLL